MTIWLASGNKHKKQEFSAILGREIMIPSDAGLVFDPEETGKTFLDNSLLKARELRLLLEDKRPRGYERGDPVIADDSGLCVDALGGRPGIMSARYGSEANGSKLGAAERNKLLLEELGGKQPRSARFVCAMVLYYSEHRFYAVSETIEGEIVSSISEAKGEGGFGYDPILYLPALGRSVAELSSDEKNAISHRGKAGKKISLLF